MFGEYELSPSLIGLSLLPTAHPSPFQRKLVRASSACYGTFTLAMGRSLGFASARTDFGALFRLALAPAYVPEGLNLASTTQLVGACKRTVSGSISLPCSGCFPPFPHGTGPLSVFRSYLALRHGRRRFRQDSTCPALLRCQPRTYPVTRTGLSPSADRLSRRFRFLACSL